VLLVLLEQRVRQEQL